MATREKKTRRLFVVDDTNNNNKDSVIKTRTEGQLQRRDQETIHNAPAYE